MKLIATKKFTPNGFTYYQKNEAFEIGDRYGETLILAGLAVQQTESGPHDALADKNAKREYKRRDMRPER